MPKIIKFTQDELNTARTMRADGKSWASISRALGVSDQTIRCAIDEEYAAKMRRTRSENGVSARGWQEPSAPSLKWLDNATRTVKGEPVDV